MKYTKEDYRKDEGRCQRCGVCKHWHERETDKGELAIGDCDKIPDGEEFTIDGKTYTYDGYSFEDEDYNEVFGCFEEEDKTW